MKFSLLKENLWFTLLLYSFLLGIIIAGVTYYFYFARIQNLYNHQTQIMKRIRKQKKKTQQVLNSQHNIIIITDV